MKKGLVIVLSAILVLGNSTMTLAGTLGNGQNQQMNETYEVKGQYVDNGSGTVYSVNVTWGGMLYNYTPSDTAWNPSTHQYGSSQGVWTPSSEGQDKITITNHSNTCIAATIVFDNTNGVSAVSGKFASSSQATSSQLPLPSAVGKTLNDSSLTTSDTLSLSGNITDTWDGTKKLGDITITIQ